ncbi:MAG: hypothetical protein WC438_02820 [Candidatus Pacearchaeota archaeon]
MEKKNVGILVFFVIVLTMVVTLLLFPIPVHEVMFFSATEELPACMRLVRPGIDVILIETEKNSNKFIHLYGALEKQFPDKAKREIKKAQILERVGWYK